MGERKMYIASLCSNGLLGGMLYVMDTQILFCTNKLTVPEKLRRLHLDYPQVERITKASLYTVEILLRSGEHYRFLVFGRKRFLKSIEQLAHACC